MTPTAHHAGIVTADSGFGVEGRILLVSPCRNEEHYMRRTLDSVLSQTLGPALWVIVDDGSSDRTPDILAEYAARSPLVRVVRREDRGIRSVGPGVIEAFYAGLEGIDLSEFEFVCKLDLDLDLPDDYFEMLVSRMRDNPRLGSCSGKPYYIDEAGRQVPEWCDDEIVVGMTKFYRVKCFEQIGGFVREVMWDGIDSHKCRLFGWIARSWDDAKLKFQHLRPMGSSDKGLLRGRRRHGRGQYFMGTAPAYLLASALRRLLQPPRLVGAMVMTWGYLGAWLKGEPRYQDLEFRRFLRRYQWSTLLRGKRRAIAKIEREREAAWNPNGPR
jgi:poly-beta-1,6-N-acetyl-D-glucosamine synthase